VQIVKPLTLPPQSASPGSVLSFLGWVYRSRDLNNRNRMVLALPAGACEMFVSQYLDYYAFVLAHYDYRYLTGECSGMKDEGELTIRRRGCAWELMGPHHISKSQTSPGARAAIWSFCVPGV
jgi:hypothetical protein